jgi:hypothetical protein
MTTRSPEGFVACSLMPFTPRTPVNRSESGARGLPPEWLIHQALFGPSPVSKNAIPYGADDKCP